MSFFRKKSEIPQERIDELLARIKKGLSNKFEVSQDKINLTTRFREDLNFDSLDSTEALIVLEEEFGIEIPDDEAEKFLTVGDVVEYLYLRFNQDEK